MNDYRKNMRSVHKETKWTMFKFLPLFIGFLIIMSVVGFTLNTLGYLGSTIVERKVFENSYQRSESIKSRIAQDEAVLAEIESQLQNPDLDKNTRFNLEAQARATRIRLSTTRGMK